MNRKPTTAHTGPLLGTARLSAPATFVGTVDATRDRARPTARTVCQAFGPYASAALIEPIRTPEPVGHRAATALGIVVTIAMIVVLALPALRQVFA